MAAAKISLDLLEHEERAKGGKEGSERDSPRTSAATDLAFELAASDPAFCLSFLAHSMLFVKWEIY